MTLSEVLQSIITFCIQIFVIFPYSALTIPRHGQLRIKGGGTSSKEDRADETNSVMVSHKVYELCTKEQSVSQLVAEDPTIPPGEAWKRLYGDLPKTSHGDKTRRIGESGVTAEGLKRVAECGNWGPTKPNELFLKARAASTKGRMFLIIG